MSKSPRFLISPQVKGKLIDATGCGAIVGAMTFTIIAGFITNGQPTFFMRYSPLIGGCTGGIIFCLFTLAVNLKKGVKGSTTPSLARRNRFNKPLQEKAKRANPKVKV